MSDFKTEFDITLAELHLSEFFSDSDRDALQAAQRVFCARTSDHPLGFESDRIEWADFEQALLRFCDLARIRHAAKHFAIREAMLVTKPLVVIREANGATRMIEGLALDPELLAMLKKP